MADIIVLEQTIPLFEKEAFNKLLTNPHVKQHEDKKYIISGQEVSGDQGQDTE